MPESNSRAQNIVPSMIIVLLVLQTVLQIFVLVNLKSSQSVPLTSGNVLQSEAIGSLVGKQAPEIKGISLDGSEKALSMYIGQPVLLVFTSHECRFCREMYPGLREFLETDTKTIVLVLATENIQANRQFQKEFDFVGYRNLYVLSVKSEVFERYSIPGTPTFVVVDSSGKIVSTGHAITVEQIAELARLSKAQTN